MGFYVLRFMFMYWLEVSVITDGEGAEAVAEMLRPFAHNDGVVLEQLGDESDPDPDALETAVTVKIYLPEEEDTPELRRRLEEFLYHMGRLYPIPPPTFRQLEEEDWANAWKAHYHPFRIGNRIWIQPSWVETETAVPGQDGIRPDDIVLILDPGMAFGTGLHPTTQMCLLALEKLVQPSMTVLDVGVGSAILSIASAKLGAKSLLGIDTDKLAVQASIDNAVINGVADRIEVRQGTLDKVARQKWDIVVVNILAPVIIGLLERDGLMEYVGENGRLILSGIIEEQAGAVETAVIAAGGQIVEKFQVRDWVAFTVLSL
ncbi:MAG: 50S ribosomal protein L11 methyltransferase [Chloroflexi bacterium]|nr:50S ribosomal protein L11 methyltransferase [Chloroflexota bacterium]